MVTGLVRALNLSSGVSQEVVDLPEPILGFAEDVVAGERDLRVRDDIIERVFLLFAVHLELDLGRQRWGRIDLLLLVLLLLRMRGGEFVVIGAGCRQFRLFPELLEVRREPGARERRDIVTSGVGRFGALGAEASNDIGT